MDIQCCPLCRDDRQLERVKDMRLCPVCEGLGELCEETQREYPNTLQLFIEGHLRRHAATK